MKTTILKSLALVALTFTIGCSSDDDSTVSVPNLEGTVLQGTITSDLNIPAGNYSLKGTVTVNNGATLTIQPGTTSTVSTVDQAAGTNYLLIEQGAKLIANGTSTSPIVFTAQSETIGAWGGIIMNGKARINAAGGTEIAEAGGKLYGGTDDADNSGSLKYVRVEYAGKKLTDNTSEMNGFSFYSVGSGTVLENLVAYKGADDGFEFYGGTVSAKNLISYGNSDDSFDWQDGWRGDANTNWYAYQVVTGNYGMEIEAKSINNAFGPKVSNITLTRAAGTVTEGGSSANEFDAIQFKKEGNGEYTNVVISGYTTSNTTLTATAVRIQDKSTNDNQVTGGKIKMFNVKINDGTSQFAGVGTTFTVAFPTGNYTTSSTATGATLTAGAWAIVDGVSLIK